MPPFGYSLFDVIEVSDECIVFEDSRFEDENNLLLEFLMLKVENVLQCMKLSVKRVKRSFERAFHETLV